VEQVENSDWKDDPHGGDWVDDNHSQEETSPLVSGVRQFAQGATSNYSDELAGVIEGAGRAAGVDGLGGPMKDIHMADGPTLDWEILKDAYKRARDKERASLAKDSKDNPTTSFAANMAGAVMSPVNKLAKGMSATKAGMVLGGVTGLGGSDKEDVPGMAEDTLMSTAMGGILGKGVEKAAPYIDKGIEKVSSGAGDLADRFAARALGAERGTIKSLGADRVKAAGRQALDEGVLSAFASTEDMAARNAALKAKGGGMMGEAYNAIDDAGASTFNPLEAAAAVDDKLGNFYRSPINRGETNQLDNTLESILMRTTSDTEAIPLREAQTLKEELGKVANWKNNLNITDKEKMARDAYKIVSQHIDDAVKNGASAVDSAGLSEILSKGKSLYSNASAAERLLDNKLAREQGNKILGITDWSVLGGGAATAPLTGGASIPVAVGATLAKKGLEKFGSQNAALGLNKISKLLMKSPEMANLYARNPQAFSSLAEKLESRLSSSPMKAADTKEKTFDQNAILERIQGTKYSSALSNAAQKGSHAFNAAHFVLQGQDPEYRKLTLEKENGQEDTNEDQDF
jgi:hypothetical protein